MNYYTAERDRVVWCNALRIAIGLIFMQNCMDSCTIILKNYQMKEWGKSKVAMSVYGGDETSRFNGFRLQLTPNPLKVAAFSPTLSPFKVSAFAHRQIVIYLYT